MFSFKVDEEISIELLQLHQKKELYELIDANREHLRRWLLWVDKRKLEDDFASIIPIWIGNYAENNGFDAGIRYKGKLVGMIDFTILTGKTVQQVLVNFCQKMPKDKGLSQGQYQHC